MKEEEEGEGKKKKRKGRGKARAKFREKKKDEKREKPDKSKVKRKILLSKVLGGGGETAPKAAGFLHFSTLGCSLCYKKNQEKNEVKKLRKNPLG